MTLGRALIDVGRFDEAQEELEFVLHAAPENLAAIRGLAEIHHHRGHAVHALVDADAVPKIAAGVPGATAIPETEEDSVIGAQIRALESFLHAVEQARASFTSR